MSVGHVVFKEFQGGRGQVEGTTFRARYFTWANDGVPLRDGPWSNVVTATWPDVVVPKANIALTVDNYTAGSKDFKVAVTFENTEFTAMSVRLQQSDDGSTGWTWLGNVVGGLDNGELATISRTIAAGKYVRVRTILQDSPRLYTYSNVIGPFEAAGTSGKPTQAPYLRINEPEKQALWLLVIPWGLGA